MPEENKFILCMKYDAKISLKNQILGAFEEHTAVCSGCSAKVLITKASLDLLKSDKAIKPLCQDCTAKFHRLHGKPKYAVTIGHLKEIESALQKAKAGNN